MNNHVLSTMKNLCYSFTFLIFLSCGKSSPKSETKSSNQANKIEDSIRAINSLMKPEMKESSSDTTGLMVKQKKVLGKYKIEFAYTAYNEEKYGFQNPGYLKVYKNNKMIFSDVFLGDNELTVLQLKNQDDKDPIFFTLNWGVEACDYVQTSRFYCITANDKVHKLGDHWASSTGDGYSSRNFDYFISQDNGNLTVVESLFYHKHDKKDLSDTIIYTFEEDKFKVHRLSNHIKSGN